MFRALGDLRRPREQGEQISTTPVDEVIVDSAAGSNGTFVRPAKNGRVSLIRADQVEPEQIEWLWPNRIPFGEITILAGHPGLGKSLLTIELAGQLSRGELGEVGPADVLLSSAEDAQAQVVVPRLKAAQAALERVHFITIDRDGFKVPPLLPNDIRDIGRRLEQQHIRLLVIDPLMAHLAPSVNAWKDQEVRAALLPLKVMAERAGAAVVVVAHLNKRQSSDPLDRLGGSVGLPGAARSVLLLGRDPADPEGTRGNRRVLAQVKNNLGPPAESLALRIEQVGEVSAARIVISGKSSFTGEDLLTSGDRTRRSKRATARELLQDLLAKGQGPVTELTAAAAEIGISETTLNRAKDDLSIKAEKASFAGGWLWSLPTPGGTPGSSLAEQDDAEDAPLA